MSRVSEFRINRFCGCLGGEAGQRRDVVVAMASRLKPAPPVAPVPVERGGLCVAGRNRGCETLPNGVWLMADGDWEFRDWMTARLDGVDPALPDDFQDAGRGNLRLALASIPGAWVIMGLDRHGNFLLARDRMGLRELFSLVRGGALYFSSNVASFRAVPGFRFCANEDRFSEYMTFRRVAGPDTMFRDVQKLLPGQALLVPAGATIPECFAYWAYRWQPPESRLSFGQAMGSIRTRIADAMGRIAGLDTGEIGVMQSGGLDSSGLLAFGEEQEPGRFVPITLVPADSGYSEEIEARDVAKRVGCAVHERIRVSAQDVFDRLFPAHQAMEEPIAHVIAVPFLSLYEAAGSRFRTLLTGECADTLFGYDRFARYDICWRYDHPMTRALAALLLKLTGSSRFQLWLDVTGPDWRRKVCLSKANVDPADLVGLVKEFNGEFACRNALLEKGDSRLEAASRYYFGTFVQDAKIFEALAALYGMEAVLPFAASPIRDVALALPPGYKFRSGRGKYILRKTLEDRLPARTVWGRKRSGEQPVGRWFREHAGMRTLVASVAHPDSPSRQYCHAEAVDRLLNRHFSGEHDESVILWQLLSFDIWHRLHVDQMEEAAARDLMLEQGEAAGGKR